MSYVALVDGADQDADNLRFIGAGGHTAVVPEVGILSIVPEVDVHVVGVVVHGGVLAGVQESHTPAEVIGGGAGEQPTGDPS